jgi:hypothetical protein
MKRLYVAGPYSANNVLDVFSNMRKGIRECTEILLRSRDTGWVPFCPWIDYQFCLALRGGEHLSVNEFYAYSMAWLEVSDAVLVLDGWENSKGTIAEIKRAAELGIPVFYSRSAFNLWRGA